MSRAAVALLTVVGAVNAAFARPSWLDRAATVVLIVALGIGTMAGRTS